MKHLLTTKSTQKELEKKPASFYALQTQSPDRATTHPVLRLQRAIGNQAVQNVVHEVLRAPDRPLDAPTRAYMEPRFGQDFSRIPTYTSTAGVIQTKLAINKPGDEYEQEADRVADQVLAAPANLAASATPPRIQRFIGQAPGPMDTAPTSVDHVLVSSGRPLDLPLRQDMEQRFGHDFSQVRLHSNAAAQQSAREVNANAYTVGHNIVFGAGNFAPGTHEGRRLIAHELTHVVQQRQPPPLRTEGEIEQPGSPASAGFAQQRDAGNGPLAHDLLQRKDGGKSGVATTLPPGIDFPLFSFSVRITTHSQLAALARVLIYHMADELKGLPDSSPLRERANEWMWRVLFTLPYLDKHGFEPLTQEVVAEAEKYMEQGGRIVEDITSEKQLPVLKALRQARDEAATVEEELKALQPELDDGLRAAYRSGKDSAIETATHMIGTSLEIGHAIQHLSREITEEFAKWKEIHLPEVSRFTEGLGLLAKGLAVINLAFALTEEKRATELEEGMRLVGLAGETFAAGVSILDAPAPMVLYANLYLMPAIKIIMAQIGQLVEIFHKENVEWVKLTGELYRCNVEPGGCSMFDFMLKVMRAGSDQDVPVLVDPVKKYLMDHREQLEAGTDEEIPTTGWWFWRDIESGEARKWMFAHRRRVWAMFYGSMPVPEQRGRK